MPSSNWSLRLRIQSLLDRIQRYAERKKKMDIKGENDLAFFINQTTF
jgi:hypothetical protein